MPVTPTYPGVYIEEAPSTAHNIIGLPTSNTAFVDVFQKGPANKPTKVTSFNEFEAIFGPLNRQSKASYGIYQFFQNGGGVAFVVRIAGANAATAQVKSKGFDIEANGPGEWGNHLEAATQTNPDSGFDLVIREVAGPKASDPDTAVVAHESYEGLSTDPNDPMYVGRVLEDQSQWVLLASAPKSAPGGGGKKIAEKDSILVGSNIADPTNESFAAFEGGKDDDVIGGASALGDPGDADGSPPAPPTGIYTLANIAPDVFNLLCLPAMSDFDPGEWITAFNNAFEFCEEHRAFLIADQPVRVIGSTTESAQVAEIESWWDGGISGTTNHAALYFPRIEIPDPAATNGLPMKTETSGTMAGIYARTDATRGVWKAPAGQDAQLINVLGTEVKLNDEDNGTLNPLGVNCIRTFPIAGTVSWGARTVDGADLLASQWKYVNVRRLTLYIEGSLQQGTQWVVFEPNAEPLWAAIRLSVGSFMNVLYEEGAFVGNKASDSYFVVCDSTTTTPLDIQQGRVNVTVGFAPLYPAEFVVITISQIADQ